jgi:hypothetical protein
MNPHEEVILALPAARSRIAMATRFRSTWLASSLQALRERGLYERYAAALSPAYAETITTCVAGMWLPVGAAVAHYETCDRLDLSSREQIAMGTQVLRHTHKNVLSMALRLATSAGASPWAIFAQSQRLWDRIWEGGAIGVYRTGEREVRMELFGWPCARFTYCRVSMRGVVLGITELFCDQANVTDVPSLRSSTSLGLRVAWT